MYSINGVLALRFIVVPGFYGVGIVLVIYHLLVDETNTRLPTISDLTDNITGAVAVMRRLSCGAT
ncbi:hypothetical protein D9758_007628 [Tetrapyrgos nigripes]|uniref:Uncharacterized protein n=1 Tax=Tetrapyrgos nigripes TaxID=182062 RepID=A0A8H5G844_9AGAR|nr:hypothetical protein D9758_007628 [Tetrapyrgos nigripes]